MDSAAPKSKHWLMPKNYYRKGQPYICYSCPYGDNKTCSMCAAAIWNVEGLMAGFSPSEAYRRAHKQDIPNSPLMQQIDKSPTPLEQGAPANRVLPRKPMTLEGPLGYSLTIPSQLPVLPSLRRIREIRRAFR